MKNQQFHNFRDSNGKFTKKRQIVANRLYSYKKIPVRTKTKLSEGIWWVTSHKLLAGAVPEKDLRFLDNKTVKDYLKNA